MKHLNKLKSLIAPWGGKIIKTDYIKDELKSPFSYKIGMNWQNKTIFYIENCADISGIIHECGHIFASKRPPNDPEEDEYNFLGWEFAVFDYLKIPFKEWEKNNYDYCVSRNPLINKSGSSVIEYGYLSPRKRALLYYERLQVAEDLGLITENCVPNSIRD